MTKKIVEQIEAGREFQKALEKAEANAAAAPDAEKPVAPTSIEPEERDRILKQSLGIKSP